MQYCSDGLRLWKQIKCDVRVNALVKTSPSKLSFKAIFLMLPLVTEDLKSRTLL